MPGLDPRRADLRVAGVGAARHDPAPARRRRLHAVRSRAARRPGPRLHPPQQRANPQGRALPGRPPPQRHRARRALRLLAGARAAGRAAGAEHLRPDAQRPRPRRPRARVARVRRAAARRRRAHQLRAAPPALVLPDQERRPARLRAAGDRGHRAASRATTGRRRRRSRTRATATSTATLRRDRQDARRRWCGSPKGSIAATRRRSPALDLYPRGDDYLAAAARRPATRSWSSGPRTGTSRRSNAMLGKPIRFEVGRAPTHKEHAPHAEQPDHAARVPGKAVRRRGHRRVRKDDAAGAAGKVA